MYSRTGGAWVAEYRGLSTDEKPILANEKKVANGSTFLEMDTGKVFLYDEEHDEWIEV